MATSYLIQAPYSTAQDNNGIPIAGAQITCYLAGTTTLATTYTDASGATAATNPIIADAAGRYVIWANVPLKIQVADAAGVTIRTTDNVIPTGVAGANSVSNNSLTQAPPYTVKGNATGATANVQDLTAGQLNLLLGGVPTHISGCLPNNFGGTTNANATIGITAGLASDSTNAVTLKSSGYSWAVTNGNAINGSDTGATLFNSFTYHMYLISGTSGTGTYLSGALAPGSVPTFPTGYNTYYRRIFSFKTNGSGVPIAYFSVEGEGGAIKNLYTTAGLVDISTAPTQTRTLFTTSLPTGLRHELLYRASTNTTGSILLTSGDQFDAAPVLAGTAGSPTAPGADIRYDASAGNVPAVMAGKCLMTNTLGQIGARSTSATQLLYFITEGFIDYRRV